MFLGAAAFNQDIGGWDVSAVMDMRGMFQGAAAFNQDIGGWDVSAVTNMNRMFFFATAFDQDLGAWDVSNVEDMEAMLDVTDLSALNYDRTLIGWSQRDNVNGVSFGAQVKYCNSGPFRLHLIEMRIKG